MAEIPEVAQEMKTDITPIQQNDALFGKLCGFQMFPGRCLFMLLVMIDDCVVMGELFPGLADGASRHNSLRDIQLENRLKELIDLILKRSFEKVRQKENH